MLVGWIPGISIAIVTNLKRMESRITWTCISVETTPSTSSRSLHQRRTFWLKFKDLLQGPLRDREQSWLGFKEAIFRVDVCEAVYLVGLELDRNWWNACSQCFSKTYWAQQSREQAMGRSQPWPLSSNRSQTRESCQFFSVSDFVTILCLKAQFITTQQHS